MSKPYIIGITGPSGAGKTTALRVLEQMGGQVYDCDAVYHEMLASDGELLGRIEAAFPGAVKDGVLDRKALGSRVFADPAGLQHLTDITQPLVKERVLERICASDATSSVIRLAGDAGCHLPLKGKALAPSPAATFVVIDAIGLFESGLGAHCDLTVAVTADEDVRVRRLMDRDGVSEEYARARIAAQKPAEWFAERADLVLENNGSSAEFAEKCRGEFTRRLNERLTMKEYNEYSYISLRERPGLERQAAAWFHDKWGVPEEAYLECMDAYLAGETELGWYLCLAMPLEQKENGFFASLRMTETPQIVGGLGVIENDFHDRKDLSPNVCAMYVEEAHRKQGIAGRLLNMAVEDLRDKGISPVYLVTDHTGFYERYGWEFFCHAQGDGEDHLTRLYIHR